MRKYIIIISLFAICSCIEQIEFDTQATSPVVVVDGHFSSILETQTIRLSTSIDLNSQVNIPHTGAKLYVESGEGTRINFDEEQEGIYTAWAMAESSQEYRLYAELVDGRQITSNFQSVPLSVPIESISVIDTTVRFLNESGQNQRLNAVDFYAHISMNEEIAQDLFLRYDTKTAYQILETVCSPFHTTKACYIYNDDRLINPILLTINEGNTTDQITNFVYRREISYRLAEVFALDLSLLSYNKTEYQYWQFLEEIFNQDGKITDVIPSRLKGNITASDGSEILGQFAVVGKSRKIKIIGNSDFSLQQLPYCGVAGRRPWPRPSECCDCLQLRGATTDKPDYWP